MKIGVDADGVETNLYEHNLREGKRYFKRNPVNYDGYSLEEIFDVNDIPKLFLYAKALKIYRNYCINEEPRENLSQVINELSTNDFEFHSITARKFATLPGVGIWARKTLKTWNKKHNINFKSYNFCDENRSCDDKLLACNKLNVDVMIEDKPDIALHLAKNGIKVLLFDAPYNKQVVHENIIRVNNWNEIKFYLEKMKSEKLCHSEFVKLDKEKLQELSLEEKKEYFDEYKSMLKKLDFNESLFNKCDRKFKLIYGSLILPVKAYFKITVFGKENLPFQDGFIMASNHLDSNDQYKIGLAIGNRPFVGYAAKEIEDTFRGKLFKITGLGIFVDRNDKLQKEESSELMANYVAHNRTALIFPEGTRKNKTEEGRKKFLNRFKIGTVALAQKTGTGILPIGLSVFDNHTVISFGELMYVKPTDDLLFANENLEKTIADLCLKNCEYYLNKMGKTSDLQKEYEKYDQFVQQISEKKKVR